MAQTKKTAVKSKVTKAAAKKPVKRQAAKAASAAKPAVKRGPAAKKSAVKPAGTKTAAAKKAAPKVTLAKKSVATKKSAVSAKKTAPKLQTMAAKSGAAKPVAAKKAVKGKVTASAKSTVPKNAQKPASKPAMTAKEVAAKKAAPAKPINQRHGFKLNEFVVYPAHGVGQVSGIEEQEIAGLTLELFVITFEKDKMTLRVPTGKCESVGMRKLAEEHIVKRAMTTLKGKARIKRTMWSRRAQEYESKINSGDLISIAEVVRDLYRSETQQEQSYSERQLYEAALDRMAREIAVIDKLDERGAHQRITEILCKSARGRRQAVEEAEAASAADDTADVKAA